MGFSDNLFWNLMVGYFEKCRNLQDYIKYGTDSFNNPEINGFTLKLLHRVSGLISNKYGFPDSGSVQWVRRENLLDFFYFLKIIRFKESGNTAYPRFNQIDFDAKREIELSCELFNKLEDLELRHKYLNGVYEEYQFFVLNRRDKVILKMVPEYPLQPIDSNHPFSIEILNEIKRLKRLIDLQQIAKKNERFTDKLTETSKNNIEGKQSLGILKKEQRQSKPTVIQWALYYCYLQEASIEPYFDSHEKGKVFALQEIAQKHSFSWKHFQGQYGKITKPESRQKAGMVNNIKAVIPLLKDFPIAENNAKKDLNLAELKK